MNINKMKYFYNITDERLRKVLFCGLFNRDFVIKEIERQLNNGDFPIRIMERVGNSSLSIELDPKDVERTLIYDYEGWNPYPTIKPKQYGFYLVQTTQSHYGRPVCKVVWWTGIGSFDDDVIAFREMPELYQPEAQE